MKLILILSFVSVHFLSFGQCNVTTTINWVNTTTPACQADNTLQIGATGIVTFDNPGDTYGTENVSVIYVTGILNLNAGVTINANIVVQNGGLVNINANVTLRGNVTVNAGGVMDIGGRLDLGVSSGACNRSLTIQPGPPAGQLILNGGSSDKLYVCGNEIFRGGSSGVCDPFPVGDGPFCAGDPPFSGGTIIPQDGLPLTLVPSGVQPIKLLFFTASLENDNVLLKWATEEEEGFDHFEIERASSNLNFSAIAEVPGAGYNTTTYQEYSWLDENPLIGHNYYRLKAVDLDGSYEYFNVVFVTTTGKKGFSVFPNPSNGRNIKYRINFDFTSGDRIILLNGMGKEIQSSPVSNIEDYLNLSEGLKPGVYFAKYSSPGFEETVKFVVH
jgi:hypothetical protein